MPKAIAGAHDAILSAAARLLAAEGYDSLNMRAIATESGLATGTIYNYYRAKDEIVFTLMLKDWETTTDRLDSLVGRAGDSGSGEGGAGTGDEVERGSETWGEASTTALLTEFFETMHGFSSKYAPVWRRMALVPHEEKSLQVKNYRTEDFVGDLEEKLGRILTARGGDRSAPGLAAPLASLITRVFSVYALDATPDRVAMELFVGKLLRP